MGWNKDIEVSTEAPKDISDFFKKSEDYDITDSIVYADALKCMIWGDAKLGKTHFALSFPEPVFVIDTEFGATPLLRKFPGKEIYIMSTAVLDPDTDEPDMDESMKKLEEGISTLRNLEKGTIVIDSGTDIWSWLGAWVEQEAVKANKMTSAGTVQRLQWGRANLRWAHMILRLMNKKGMHFVITAQPKELYDNKGVQTGIFDAKIQGQTKFKCDIVLRVVKEYDDEEEKTIYVTTPTDCRFQRDWEPHIRDITFEKLATAMHKDLGVVVPDSLEAKALEIATDAE